MVPVGDPRAWTPAQPLAHLPAHRGKIPSGAFSQPIQVDILLSNHRSRFG